MKKLVKFSLTALCLATLTACSSGGKDNGGADNSSTQTNATNTVVNNNANSNNNSNTTGNVANTNNNATNTATNTSQANNTSVIGVNGETAANIVGSKLTVDGKTFELSPQGINSNNINMIAGNTELVKSVTPTGISYGFVSEGRGKDRYAFVTSSATETSKMPVSGVANYEGRAIFANGGNNERINTFAMFANFSSKEVGGFISGLESGQSLNFVQSSSKIEGNTFSVRAEGYSQNEVVEVKGKFYGDVDAVGGTFVSPDKSISGAFGGDVIKSHKRVQY